MTRHPLEPSCCEMCGTPLAAPPLYILRPTCAVCPACFGRAHAARGIADGTPDKNLSATDEKPSATATAPRATRTPNRMPLVTP